MMFANTNFSIAPTPRPFGKELPSDLTVEGEEEVLRERLLSVDSTSNVVFDSQDSLSQQRSELRIAQEPTGCLDIPGGAAWR